MTTSDKPKVGAILLAAGASRGLGHPKQLVVYEGQTLIRRAAEMLVASRCDPVVVVLGAVVEDCRREIEDLRVMICINENYSVGISSSIAAGLNCLIDVDATLIALCDQPFVTTVDYDALVDQFIRTRSEIVAAAYKDVIGVPAVFSKSLFPDLQSLNGDEGARFFVRQNIYRTQAVSMPAAGFDVDTAEDERRLASSLSDG